jgi:hypothetical protein
MAASRWIIWPLLGVTAATIGLLTLAISTSAWWTTVPSVLFVAFTAVLWDNRLSARAGWPGGRLALFLAGRRVRRGKVRLTEPNGRPMQTIDEIRVEYAQTILDNATDDPQLDGLLNESADAIDALLRKPGSGKSGPRALDALTITAYANRLLDAMSEPNQRPTTPPYRSYSGDMLTIAAMCRLAGRLPTVAIPGVNRRRAAT